MYCFVHYEKAKLVVIFIHMSGTVYIVYNKAGISSINMYSSLALAVREN